MRLLVAVLCSIVCAILSNIILDYLPYTRVYLRRKIRDFTIQGGQVKQFSLETAGKIDLTKLYKNIPFPYCHQCNHSISWLEYLLQRHCPTCKSHQSRRFFILLVVLPLLFTYVTLFPVGEFRIGDIYLLITFYVIVFIMDVEHRLILFPVTIAGILFGVYFGVSYHGWLNTLFGGLGGGGIMFIFYLFGILYANQIRKRRDAKFNEVALGFGDVSLCLILGFILGWPGILGGLFIGIVTGGIISGGLLLMKLFTKKYAPNDLILPYAPFLVIGAFVIMLI
jgi:prepilin signal peptidase PulO-like enzyme (type II secretory pathway)